MSARCILLLGMVFIGANAQHLPRPLVVNVDHRGQALQPSLDLHPDGSPRFIWNTYQNHQERLFTALFRNGRRSQTQELGAGAGVHWMPRFLADGDDAGWAVWQERHGLEWRIVSRRLEDGFWHPIETLSQRGRDSLIPSAVVHQGELVVAWEDHTGGAQRVALRGPDGSSRQVSQAAKPCYRPELASADDELWAFWDC